VWIVDLIKGWRKQREQQKPTRRWNTKNTGAIFFDAS